MDLSQYVLVGRYDLPEPTRTTAPSGNLLAQEASAVTYNWDTNTLFITGDGSTSIVQVSLTGELIDSMTLAAGTSPQGTDFYDTEGLTYIGGGQFVFTEERYRQIDKVTYVAGTTISHADAQTVDLGTNIGNIGLEGITYDPLTNGFILVKEKDPLGLFQTTVDFAAGTASNGSSTTVNSTNLFDPALVRRPRSTRLPTSSAASIFSSSPPAISVSPPVRSIRRTWCSGPRRWTPMPSSCSIRPPAGCCGTATGSAAAASLLSPHSMAAPA